MKKAIFTSSIITFPSFVFADGLTNLLDAATSLLKNTLIPLAFALCLLYFFWGVAKYIREGAVSDKAAEEGRRIMVWGIVGLFVASSIWGIITFIQGELQVTPIEVQRPDIDVTSSSIKY